MKLDTNPPRFPRVTLQLALLTAVALPFLGCSHPAVNGGDDDLYAHGYIHVDAATAQRWNASEKEVEAAGARIKPIADRDGLSVPFGGDAVGELKALSPSMRHGAGDKRLLSILDTTGGRKAVVSSGILAEVTLVKGSEYKSDSDFKRGWLPLAIVVLPPRPERDPVLYPKLGLHGDTSWIYVHEREKDNWVGSVVRLVNGKVQQTRLDVTASKDDLEPILGARFKWEDDDESIWGTCGGNCCKVTVHPQ